MNIGVTIQRETNTGSVNQPTKPVKMAVIGLSNGGATVNVNIPLNLTAGDTTADTFADSTVKSIQRVSLNQNDYVNVFKQGIDYQLTSPNTLTWLNASMNPPELEGSVVATDGSIGTTTLYYKLTVLDQNSEESTGSNALTLTASSGATNKHRLNWTKVAFASGYKIYRSTDGTTYNKVVTTITTPSTVTYDVTGGESLGTATIPVTNKARRIPKTGTGSDSTYYADYTAVTFNYEPKLYNNLTEVIKDHGNGSHLTNISRILFRYMNVPEIYLCAVEGVENSKYVSAIDKFITIDNVNYISALKDSTTVQDYVVNHCKIYSDENQEKERFAVVTCGSSISEVGSSSTAGTVLYFIASLQGEKRAIPVIPNGNKIYADFWEDSNGVFTENVLIDNHYLGALMSGLYVTADDVASSVINKLLPGINPGPGAIAWNDNVESDKIMNAGGTYIQIKNGDFIVYNDNTNAIDTQENKSRPVLSAEDEMKRRMRTALTQYKGRKLTSGALKAIKSTVNDVLGLMVQDVLITSYSITEVVQDTAVKTQVNITWEYEPVYIIEKILGKYSFDTL